MKADESLQRAIDEANEGTSLCLAPGLHAGPLVISRRLLLWGPREAVIRSSGTGTTVLVTGVGARLEGFSVSGSGGRFDTTDAAVKVHADNVVVRGIRVTEATFGILVEQSKNVEISGCIVRGIGGDAMGLRGDGIRLWEAHHSRIEDNLVIDGRDLVVWYSSDNILARNTVHHGRYGTHLMYSHRNRLVKNRYYDNVVGVFVMYSRDITLEDNRLVNSSGAAGMGLGLKESGNLTVRGNRFVHDTIGVYVDMSPQKEGDANLFEHNEFRLGQTAVVFHSSQSRNTFRANAFRDNLVAVQVEGGGNALDVVWEGNDFDDYAGYDLDGDGTGDLPYELRSASGELASRHPETAFFNGTPAIALVDMVSRALPLFAPTLLVRDARPRVGSLAWEGSNAR